VAPQVRFEPRISLLRQPTPAHSILIWGEVSRQPLRTVLDSHAEEGQASVVVYTSVDTSSCLR